MLTALDEVANQDHLQMIKAVIPYLPPPGQRMLSLCIKLTELQNVMNFYNRHEICMNSCGDPPESASPTDILTDIRSYCDPNEQSMIDQMLRIFSMLDLYSMLTTSGEGLSFPDLLSGLGPMMANAGPMMADAGPMMADAGPMMAGMEASITNDSDSKTCTDNISHPPNPRSPVSETE